MKWDDRGGGGEEGRVIGSSGDLKARGPERCGVLVLKSDTSANCQNRFIAKIEKLYPRITHARTAMPTTIL
jgi:hypothetical protein